MKSRRSTSAFLTSRKDRSVLCHVQIEFSETHRESSRFGSVTIIIRYSDPGYPDRLKYQTLRQSWWKQDEMDFKMGITQFTIPVCLRSHSIAQFIWSEIYKGLPEEVRDNLLVFGSMNSGDAFSPITDSSRQILIEQFESQPKPVMINQIERRNRLWMSILSPDGKTAPVFTCDDKGNGAFSGYIKDPLEDKSLDKIAVEYHHPAQELKLTCKHSILYK